MAAAAEALKQTQEYNQSHLTLVSNNPYPENVGISAERAPTVGGYAGRIAVEALHAEYDAITELAELVDGQMRSDFEITYDGEDLYGPDGRSLTVTAENGLRSAIKDAKKNENLTFEIWRRKQELDEVNFVKEVIKSGEANTVYITSDFPEHLRGAKEDVGGYNVTRQQAFARAYIITPNKITMFSQTLDGSNRKALEATSRELGFECESGTLLAQRQAINLSPEKQDSLMDRVTDTYDNSMRDQFGGEWYAGRSPADYRNTFDFVREQTDLIDMYKQLRLNGKLTDRARYDLAATINERFKKAKDFSPSALLQSQPLTTGYVRRQVYNLAELYMEVRAAGLMARKEGRTFSACGGTFKAEGFNDSTESLLSGAGFGSRNESSGSWHGGKTYKNEKCVSCNKVKSEVGYCHICKDCVDNPKK